MRGLLCPTGAGGKDGVAPPGPMDAGEEVWGGSLSPTGARERFGGDLCTPWRSGRVMRGLLCPTGAGEEVEGGFCALPGCEVV